MDAVNEFIAQAAASPWVYLVVFAVVLVDAFFPPVPSESVVIAAAAAAVAVGTPNLALVIACAAAGAIAGDNLTYAIGRRVPLERIRLLRGPRMSAALARARSGIHKRTGVLVLSARYVPVGRVAVNLMAGASGVAARRFLLLSSVAGASWAVYSVTVGVIAAQWLGGNALLAMIVGIVLGVSTGVVIDAVLRRAARRRERRDADSLPEPAVLAAAPSVSYAEEVVR
ncbi:DedA family protein [Leifsonia aquatica]|uniref:SNARE-like domain protein n=2 Tax=Leifsonia aquatica TaxID=144185 RepID=U2RTW9_LEIAQ|nr:VTT domain-containing protein [Leifsonia aquatica]ERK72226.1 SNARE-like domain protein [Leifsonia aquatica ATCC 14665]MBB2966574.1 membrane protein DedA with SNARE-associated domain [Leifsonia aquatica]